VALIGRFLWHRLLLLTTGLGVAQVCGAATAAPEYRVKAAFIYKFATYIRWPASAGVEGTAPFVIGIIGADPFGSSLAEVVRDQTVQGRAIRIRALSRAEEALECDLVFVSPSERENLARLLAVLRSAPVLTVSDMNRFAERGGMIGLVTTEGNRVRFDINRAAIERTGLRASSQLLQLARIIDEPRQDGGHR
jgi:hypothetical protein